MAKTVKFKGVQKNFKKRYDTQYGPEGQRLRGLIEFKNGIANGVPDVVAGYLCKNENFSIESSKQEFSKSTK